METEELEPLNESAETTIHIAEQNENSEAKSTRLESELLVYGYCRTKCDLHIPKEVVSIGVEYYHYYEVPITPPLVFRDVFLCRVHFGKRTTAH